MSQELILALNQIAEIGQEGLVTGFIVFLRIGAVLALAPVFGEQSVPIRVRLAVAVCFTLIVAPAVQEQLSPVVAEGEIVTRVLVTETIAGLAMGIIARLFVLALQMAGTIIAQSISLSQFFGGAGVEPQPAVSQLLVVSGLAVAAMNGLHVHLASVIILSYDLIPPGEFLAATDITKWGLDRISNAVAFAFSLSAPFIIASLIYNVALGVINRAMPQLMVSFIGAPALALGGLSLLLLVLPLSLGVWSTGLEQFFADPFASTP